MYNVTDKYKAFIASSIVRKTHSKIVVDGVEYGGDVLKTFPRISCKADFLGSFPAKTCSFEIYKRPGLDLVGKEFEVYRGLEIEGAIEWIPMGLFTAAKDGVKTSDSGDSIAITAYDRAARFDVEYVPIEIEYPTTIGAWVQELAFRRGVNVATTPFPCCDILLEAAPNIPTGTTEREIIRQVAEVGGANAVIDRAGELLIRQPVETAERIPKRKYTGLTKEALFGGINTVVLGKQDYEDDIVFENAEAVAANGRTEWRLENNIFAEADRAEWAEYIGQTYIIGLQYTPFSASGCVDDWYLDIGDIVEIEDKEGAYFKALVLSYETTDRIKSTIGAAVPGEMNTNYEIAGTTKKQLRYVMLQVDHVNNTIQSIAHDVEEVGGVVTELESKVTQTAEGLESKVSRGNIISSINQSAEEVKIDASRVNITGLLTVEDVGKNGQTVIDGARIDTSTLTVGGWLMNDNGLYYGEDSAPDLYLGTVGVSAFVGDSVRSDIVFKAGDSFAVCSDGCLYADSGEFGGDLTGETCRFTNLQARDGGTIKVGDWSFVENGLEYADGVFDLEYSGGVAKISGTVPMQIGPWANGVVNSLMLYGTSITFGVSTSNYQAVMDTSAGYSQICFRPQINNTGNIGTASYIWDSGHFRNLHVHGALALDNLTATTLNINSMGRVNTSMVIGSPSAAQPSEGLKVYRRVVIDSMLTATDTSSYADDKVVTAGSSSGTLYKTGVPLSRLYDVVGTSTAKKKHNISPLGNDYDIFDSLSTIQFNYNNTGEKGLGLLAEDLEKLAPDLCYFDDNGDVEGIKYNSIIALLIREVQKLKAERIG